MTLTSTHCIPEQFTFERVESRQVIVNFLGRDSHLDAGLMLIAAHLPKTLNNRPIQC